MSCYLGHSKNAGRLIGKCRDVNTISVLRCEDCGLVYLDNLERATEEFYENSGMYEFQKLDRVQLMDEERADTDRRVRSLAPIVKGKRFLDFGCGTGAVAAELKASAAHVSVVELNLCHREAIARDWNIEACRSVGETSGSFDIISLFHVLEHLPDPISTLRDLRSKLAPGGKVIIEVPNADDALISRYRNRKFQDFTYWSLHLFLFTEETLRCVLQKSGFGRTEVEYVQRYPLANHLLWLAEGRPGGHVFWKDLVTPALNAEYERVLAGLRITDTLISISSV